MNCQNAFFFSFHANRFIKTGNPNDLNANSHEDVAELCGNRSKYVVYNTTQLCAPNGYYSRANIMIKEFH